jgi:hypothetical protein
MISNKKGESVGGAWSIGGTKEAMRSTGGPRKPPDAFGARKNKKESVLPSGRAAQNRTAERRRDRNPKPSGLTPAVRDVSTSAIPCYPSQSSGEGETSSCFPLLPNPLTLSFSKILLCAACGEA